MATILGKNLDSLDVSLETTAPYELRDTSIAAPQFITGDDLKRSAKIDSSWREPLAQQQISYDQTKVEEAITTFGESAVSAVKDLPEQAKSLTAQVFLEMTGQKNPIIETLAMMAQPLEKSDSDVLRSYGEAVQMLNERDYPIKKAMQRVIANSTATIENRKALKDLYRNAHGVDSESITTQAAEIIGNMAPMIALGGGVGSIARTAGLSRIAAGKAAEAVMTGTIALQEGGQYAEETAAQYLERTGDKTFADFEAKDARGMSALAVGAINAKIEMLGGVEPLMGTAMKKIGLKTSVLTAGIKTAGGEAAEEALQNLTSGLARKIDGTSQQTWGEILQDSATAAAWGAFIGGPMGAATFAANRANLVKGIKQMMPNVTEAQATQIANTVIDNTVEISSQNPAVRARIRRNVEKMYENIDLPEAEKEDAIEAQTQMEYDQIAMFSVENGISIEENPLVTEGTVTELGWVREHIPEQYQAQIDRYLNNIEQLETNQKEIQAQIEELRKDKKTTPEQIQQLSEQLDTIEQKLETLTSDQYKIDFGKRLYRQAYAERNAERARAREEVKQAEKETKRAEREAIREARTAMRAQLKADREAAKAVNQEKRDVKNAIKGGNIDIISDILSKNGFRTRGLSGTAIKELAKLNWQMFKGVDLGQAKSRGAVQTALAEIEANVESGNTVLGRAGYTQEQIDKMDDETWNRAILAQYRKEQAEIPAQTDEEPDWEALEDIDIEFQGQSKKRGAYVPILRLIIRLNKMDSTTLSHELAHDWFDQYVAHMRSGKASKEFKRSWGQVEKALGLPENPTQAQLDKASETYAKAYEAWLLNKQDWTKAIDVADEKQRAAMEDAFLKYQAQLKDIYDNLLNPYFKETWGEIGELKPEVMAWFDKATGMAPLQSQVARGEITQEQANAIATLETIASTVSERQEVQERIANDTTRYEVEGGNVNRTITRLQELARNIDETNADIKGNKYDTRRDMMQVARDADNFVKTRREEAMDIINGIAPEVEGLYREDLFTAMKRVAQEEGDIDLLKELATSPIAQTMAKQLGQRVIAFRNFQADGDINITSAINTLDQAFQKAYDTEKGKSRTAELSEEYEAEVSIQDAKSDKDLDNILKEMECKL